MTQKQLIKVAKLEIHEWRGLPNDLAMFILFAFVHRVTTGETVEEKNSNRSGLNRTMKFDLCLSVIDRAIY